MDNYLLNNNLNLLPILEVLIEECHVSRAAEHLCLTQSAVSRNLIQLREAFNDPILVRTESGKMRATKYAQSLLANLKKVNCDINNIFSSRSTFNSKQDQHDFTIAVSSHIISSLHHKLALKFYNETKKSCLIVKSTSEETVTELLRSNKIDVAIGNFSNMPDICMQQRFFVDYPVLVMSKCHPLSSQTSFDFDMLSKMTFIEISVKKNRYDNLIYQYFLERGTTLKSTLITDCPYEAIKLSVDLPLAVIVLNSVAEFARQTLPIQIKKFSFDTPKHPIFQYWLPAKDKQAKIIWLRELISSISVI